MIWNHPAAFAGLALLAAPVLVHLLIRRHAARVVFPAMRFVPAVRAAAVRVRTPSDVGLLLLRCGIVAAAVLAAAQPLFVTAARTRAWDARLARAVIVDTSPSVPAPAAARLADEAARGAFVSRRFDAADLRDAVRRAADWLATAPTARREIAIVSDFQRGAVGAADFSEVPLSTGIVVLRAGVPNAGGQLGAVDGWRDARWEPGLVLDAASTQVTWSRAGAIGPAALTVRAAAADQAAAERAARAARSFGVPAAVPPRRIDVAFAGAAVIPDTPAVTLWIASAAMALGRSELIAQAGVDVRVGERDGVMSATVPLSGASPLAPAVIRAVLLAAAPAVADPEAETAALDDATLAQWRREPAPAGTVGPSPDESDGRWAWALALGLLFVEGRVRRRSAASVRREPPSSALRATGAKHADAA
jgi:hypothetical protein